MVDRCTLPQGRRLSNRRGAVFLLAVYFISMMFLLLGGVSLQRTLTETRAASVSRDIHQAFWVAEGGLDQGLYDVLWNEPQGLILSNDKAKNCTSERTVEVASGQQAKYTICLQDLPARYSLDSSGSRGITTQNTTLLTGEIERQTPELKFQHTIYTTEGIKIQSGLIQGSIATSATGPNAIQLLDQSLLQGDIALPPDRDKALDVSAESPVHLAGSLWRTEDGTSDQQLTDIKDLDVQAMGNLIPIVIPHKLQGKGKIQPLPGHDPNNRDDDKILRYTDSATMPCLVPGTYYAKGVALTRSTVCTSGPVDLYVEGSIVLIDSSLYGQRDAASVALGKDLAVPANLRIFALPDDEHDSIRLEGTGFTAATLYTPDMGVVITKGHEFRGALISKTADIQPGAFVLPSPGAGGKAIYDVEVKKNPIRHSPTLARVALLLWGAHGQGSSNKRFVEATAAAATTSFQNTGGGGGCGGGGSCVICTELHRQKYLSDAWFAADLAYGRTYSDMDTWVGYYAWAHHVAKGMQRSALLTALVRPFAMAWAQHMAFVMGESKTDNLLGRLLNDTFVPLNRALGKYLTTRPRQAPRPVPTGRWSPRSLGYQPVF